MHYRIVALQCYHPQALRQHVIDDDDDNDNNNNNNNNNDIYKAPFPKGPKALFSKAELKKCKIARL